MIYMFLADGFEEIEALATLDILRRGSLEVTTVGVTGKQVSGSHNIKVIPDIFIDDISDYTSVTGVILPGGIPGTPNLEANEKVISLIKYCQENNKFIGAICAAPSVLGHLGVLKGKKSTCYPGYEKELQGAVIGENSVEVSDNVITAKGAGVSFDFGFAILEKFKGSIVVEELKKSMQCRI